MYRLKQILESDFVKQLITFGAFLSVLARGIMGKISFFTFKIVFKVPSKCPHSILMEKAACMHTTGTKI